MVPFLRWLPRLVAALLAPACVFADPDLSLPPNVPAILDHIYSGRRDLALQEVLQLQAQSPTDPLGYLLEAEVEWWKIWCTSAEFKYGMTLARHHDKAPSDAHYFELTSRAYTLAESNLHQHDAAQMYLYAGMADALAGRVYSLRGEYRATARAGVRARENFLKALALDPSIADADTGLGLYNYYVDTLSGIARVLRFFMGIPGGSKQEGIHQLQRAMRDGKLTPPEARFYLAVNLLNYDQRYEEALNVVGPLVEKYPENPTFLLLRGDLYAKLGRKSLAEASYRSASASLPQVPEPDCRAKLTRIIEEAQAALNPH